MNHLEAAAIGTILGFYCFGVAYAAPTGRLNDTGQTLCVDPSDQSFTNCGDLNQDGRYGRDAASLDQDDSFFSKPAGSGGNGAFAFTPLDVNGNPIPLAGNPPVPSVTPQCIWDRTTNLIWEVKTSSGLQDRSSTYGWLSNNTGLCSGGSGCSTSAFIADLNAINLCGETSNNWRLPTRRELLSIVDHSRTALAIDTSYFPNTINAFYWSSDVCEPSPLTAWIVDFQHGGVVAWEPQSSPHQVRLVRSGL